MNLRKTTIQLITAVLALLCLMVYSYLSILQAHAMIARMEVYSL
jgi:hypothetical protein